MILTILGGNTLLGRHLINISNDYKYELNIWNVNDDVVNNNPIESPNIKYFTGMDSIANAIRGSDVVINAYEYLDLSCNPQNDYLNIINYDFVTVITDICHEESVTNLIQISSIYLQCTPMWPNVNNREIEGIQKNGLVPFKAYVNSKAKTEQFLSQQENLKVIIARIGCLYGEGDVSSPICDMIYAKQYLGYLPIYGDRGGIFQMSYAGNIAYNILEIAEKLNNGLNINYEIVTIKDETPNMDIYSTTILPLIESEKMKNIPFFLLFPLFILAAFISRIVGYFHSESMLNVIPDPIYVYFLFRHWTFLSDFKQKIFLDIKPRYTYEESIEKCHDYYKNLDINNIKSPSWISM